MSTPTVTITTTFETIRWSEICDHCGASADNVERDYRGLHNCESCGEYVGSDLAEYPDEERGFCDPLNPWGSVSWGDDEPTTVTLPVDEAAALLADTSIGIWGYRESDAREDYRTGENTTVTAHISGSNLAMAVVLHALGIL